MSPRLSARWTVYTLNAETLFAINSPTNSHGDLFLCADLRYTSLLAMRYRNRCNVKALAIHAPTSTITFQDIFYQGVTRLTNILASRSARNGVTSVTNSSSSPA
jgi:hypothetical protein